MNDTDALRAAKCQVNRKLGFYIHLAVFLIVNLGLVVINALFSPHIAWSAWPLLGWGIGLLFHGLAVFLHASGASWKQRMIENELKKLGR